jgi:hypothetical protein
LLRRWASAEVVKQRHAVGLGPDTRLATPGYVRILDVNVDLTVQRNLDGFSFVCHSVLPSFQRHTMPLARSSLPETALNLTSTKPSATAVALRTHQGNGATPPCFKTLGRLGAETSASTVHSGLPAPVVPQVHPTGS